MADDLMERMQWGFAIGSRVRHVFARPTAGRTVYDSDDEATRTLQPRALCGMTWAPKWPPATPPGWFAERCKTCQRLYSRELQKALSSP